jgi:hypothetical protein
MFCLRREDFEHLREKLYSSNDPPMTNTFYTGLHKEIELPDGGFLFIGDEVPEAAQSRNFDHQTHAINPLKGMTYKSARALADVLYTISPQGENTLTVRNGKRSLLKAFLTTTRLDKIEGDEEVQGMVSDILVSPVLRRVLCTPTNFSFNPNSKIFARINRAELGDFDALVLGLVLIGHYKGQLIIPDFGFYGRDAHVALVRENRLIAGVHYLDELPLRLRRACLLISDKRPSHVLHEDAKTLAENAGLRPDFLREDNEYNKFIDRVMA